ncbi:hypothetical protein J7E63_12805 [Bacillus sp. ISL-75]|uniref:hypothetical protein n=1 Tax=Bacillus sp. ISL-75 TaxID=2819137 RepID=UPI001BE59B11|nr:hypothetical protein [Bacillus sp. ISL-75]MBT2727818.1 hypothetical protein [Bacillus sp. ISL-75]
MVLLVNIITIGVLSIIFILLVMGYLKNAFFDITILYRFTILLAPIILFIVNLIFLYLTKSSLIFFSILPLLIPLIYSSIVRLQDFQGHKTYKEFKEFSKVLVRVANESKINISPDDVRIRIKQRNNVSIIFNVYSSSDEQIIKSLLADFQKTVKNAYKKYNVEFLIDKKKGNNSPSPIIQYN